MDDNQQLEAIQRQLDVIASQLARLADDAERQRPWSELASEIAPTLRTAHQAAQAQLAEIKPYVNQEDLFYLMRHFACNAGDLIAALEQLESLRDLVADAGPLTVEASESLIERLDELERRGYFAVAREVAALVDVFVRELDQASIRQWRAQVPELMAAAKDLGQPETMALAARVASRLRQALQKPIERPPSLWRLLMRLRQPEARRGLAIAVELLAALGATRHLDGASPEVDTDHAAKGDL